MAISNIGRYAAFERFTTIYPELKNELSYKLNMAVSVFENKYTGSVKPYTGHQNPVYTIHYKKNRLGTDNIATDAKFTATITDNHLIQLKFPLRTILDLAPTNGIRHLDDTFYREFSSLDYDPGDEEANEDRLVYTLPSGGSIRIRINYSDDGNMNKSFTFCCLDVIPMAEFLDMFLGTRILEEVSDRFWNPERYAYEDLF